MLIIDLLSIMNNGLFANPIFRMGKVVHECVHRANIALEEQDCLSFSLFIILLRVKYCQPLLQKELAQEMAHSGAAVSRQITKLEKEGLINREHGNDRRSLYITITNKGIATLDLCEQVISPIMDEYLQLLSLNQQQDLSTILNRLANGSIKST